MIRFIDEKGIIEPADATRAASESVREYGAVAAVTGFSDHIFGAMIDRYNGKKIGVVRGGCDNDIYGITYNGKRIAAYKSPVGAPAAVMAAEEVLACGIDSIVAFGICGALTSVPERTFIVPTEAYRDEGTSFHYCAASETIALKNSGVVVAAFERYGLKALKGPGWCTDALYRETRTRFDEMRAHGCLCVDMECSALQAACDYRGKNFYTFFITADSLAGEKWQPNYILDISLASMDEVGAAAAVRLASEL